MRKISLERVAIVIAPTCSPSKRHTEYNRRQPARMTKRSSRRRHLIFITAVVCAALARPAGADEPAVGSAAPDAEPTAAAAADLDVQERLRFIEKRLDGQVAGAEAWTWSWVTFNLAGGIVQSYRAAGNDNEAERTDQIVAAAKAAIGIASRLSRPLHARRGAAELRGLPAATPDERARKLAHAERLLARNARESDVRYRWLPHVLNVALNVAGAAIVWAVHDAPGVAWQSAAIGMAVGEVSIWTQPYRPAIDRRAYERRFSGRPSLARIPEPSPGLRIGLAGNGLEIRF
jgi:hypothetical protein